MRKNTWWLERKKVGGCVNCLNKAGLYVTSTGVVKRAQYCEPCAEARHRIQRKRMNAVRHNTPKPWITEAEAIMRGFKETL